MLVDNPEGEKNTMSILLGNVFPAKRRKKVGVFLLRGVRRGPRNVNPPFGEDLLFMNIIDYL